MPVVVGRGGASGPRAERAAARARRPGAGRRGARGARVPSTRHRAPTRQGYAGVRAGDPPPSRSGSIGSLPADAVAAGPARAAPAGVHGVRPQRRRQHGRAPGRHAAGAVRAPHPSRPGARVLGRRAERRRGGRRADAWRWSAGSRRCGSTSSTASCCRPGSSRRPSSWPGEASRSTRTPACAPWSSRCSARTTFADLVVPFQCVATDIDQAREVWFSEGPLIEPILASAALPAVLPPVEIDGVRYMDGAVLNDVPGHQGRRPGRHPRVRAAHRHLRPAPARAPPAPRRGPPGVLDRPPGPLPAGPGRAAAGREVTILPTGEAPVVRFNDLRQSRRLIDVAYQASAEALESGGSAADRGVADLSPHAV